MKTTHERALERRRQMLAAVEEQVRSGSQDDGRRAGALPAAPSASQARALGWVRHGRTAVTAPARLSALLTRGRSRERRE
jgi:hypothetical protein